MLDTRKKRNDIGKWIVGIFTCCALIFLGIRHIKNIADVIVYLADLIQPLLLGIILALILNVPMGMFERFLKRKTSLKKGVRPLAILLSLGAIVAIVTVVAVLVIPELINAVKLIAQIISGGVDQLDALDENAAFMETAVGRFLADLNIDWGGLQTQLNEFIGSLGDTIMDEAVSVTSSFLSGLVTFIMALIFAIYILGGKEKLKRQSARLLRVWLPEKVSGGFIHVCSVFAASFHQFIGGQAVEAVILGTLCTIGMLILRIPYAGMVGALVGVTAMIPFVGAYFSAIVGAIMIFTVSPIKALIFLIYIIALQQTENNLIYPRVVGTRINLPAIWVLAAVTVGGNIGGPAGMLLGVPAASAIYALIREATDKREREKAALV